MIRAYLYLLVAGIIWMVEGFLFSYYLGFAVWQTVLIGLLYLSLFGLVVRYLFRSLDTRPGNGDEMSTWRLVSLAPMLVVIVGSFASLPLVIAVAALGKI